MGAAAIRCKVWPFAEGTPFRGADACSSFDIAVFAFVVSGVVVACTHATDWRCLASLPGVSESEAVPTLVRGAGSVVFRDFSLEAIDCNAFADDFVRVVFG